MYCVRQCCVSGSASDPNTGIRYVNCVRYVFLVFSSKLFNIFYGETQIRSVHELGHSIHTILEMIVSLALLIIIWRFSNSGRGHGPAISLRILGDPPLILLLHPPVSSTHVSYSSLSRSLSISFLPCYI
jgi:hypothetical protein